MLVQVVWVVLLLLFWGIFFDLIIYVIFMDIVFMVLVGGSIFYFCWKQFEWDWVYCCWGYLLVLGIFVFISMVFVFNIFYQCLVQAFVGLFMLGLGMVVF